MGKFAKVRVTYEVEVPVTDVVAAQLDKLDPDAEEGVIYRALDQIKEDFGRNRTEEIVDVRE